VWKNDIRMKKKTLFVYLGIILLVAVISGFLPASKDLDPSKWTKVVVTDTVNVPIQKFGELAGKVNLESAAGERKYDNLPRIERTKNIVGDFSKEGDSRIVYFSTGDSVIETILIKKEPYVFGYEITKASLPMKRVAYRARGLFEHSALDDKRTLTKWTYSFQHKNFISKFFIKRYINNTHRSWMNDMLKATKLQIEKAYNTP
jgi:hypothetical protein